MSLLFTLLCFSANAKLSVNALSCAIFMSAPIHLHRATNWCELVARHTFHLCSYYQGAVVGAERFVSITRCSVIDLKLNNKRRHGATVTLILVPAMVFFGDAYRQRGGGKLPPVGAYI